MGNIKWIKLTVDMFDDQKIRVIELMPSGKNILLIWVKLLTLAGKKNDLGRIYLEENIPYTREILTVLFNEDILVVDLALKTLNDLKMIDINEAGVIFINNWEFHQNIEGMEKIREQSKNRMRKMRDKQKQLNPGVEENVTQQLRNVTQQKKNKKENKKVHVAEFVSLTEEEKAKLIEAHGQAKFEQMIHILNTYKGSSGKVYKSDYMAILNWVVERASKQPLNIQLNKTNSPKKLIKTEQKTKINNTADTLDLFKVYTYDDGTTFEEFMDTVPKI